MKTRFTLRLIDGLWELRSRGVILAVDPQPLGLFETVCQLTQRCKGRWQ